MELSITIPLEKSFNLPEGHYRGRLDSISRKFKTTPGSYEEQPRLLWEVVIPSIKNRIPMAGRTFTMDLKPGSELRTFLENWLGRKFFEDNSGKTITLDSLIGREADLILVHFHNKGYERPLVFIQAAFPPGTLKLTEQPLMEGGKD